MTVLGSGFVAGSSVSVNGAAQKAAFVDSNTLAVTLDPAALKGASFVNVIVANPGPSGGTSSPVYPVAIDQGASPGI